MGDRPWWTKTSSEKFTARSGWELLRKKREESNFFKNIWVKGLTIKFSFISWRYGIIKYLKLQLGLHLKIHSLLGWYGIIKYMKLKLWLYGILTFSTYAIVVKLQLGILWNTCFLKEKLHHVFGIFYYCC